MQLGHTAMRAQEPLIRAAAKAGVPLPDEEFATYKNKTLYYNSFHVTQKEMLWSVQRATGTTDVDWDIKHKDIAGLAKE
ncbi:hypothetical protein FZEAL_728 [Fusarium zealandicum]|uniref:Uncharacterized protein n=1 Tax=Fusarium zealandicum TaxID=1053134 RepID=A0A8H4UU58_9HYPO|nr:hypothetical protein FZEAL_728 [Fusarium zealandicum]